MPDTEPKIHLKSSRFGDLEVPECNLIQSPEGIIGFPDSSLFALLDPSGGQSLFLWLQAVDNPDLAFIITNPLSFFPDYQIDTSEPDLERLDLARKSTPALFVIVSVPPNDPDKVSANLLAPLLYFESDNTLYQIILEKARWPLKCCLLGQEESTPDTPSDESESTGEVL